MNEQDELAGWAQQPLLAVHSRPSGQHDRFPKTPKSTECPTPGAYSILWHQQPVHRPAAMSAPHAESPEGWRTAVVVSKTRPTPAQYPRKPGVPSKKPL